MGQTLDKTGKKVDIANVVHHGEKLILPIGMDIPGAIELLKRRWQYLQEEVVIDETFDVFPWDGAHAFDKVLRRRYGWAPATAVQTMFGPNPPKMITIATGPKVHDKTSIPWGKFELPNVKGEVHTTTGMKEGRICFRLYAKVKREGEDAVHALCEDLRQELILHSIYRGQAIKIRFRNDNGSPLEMPEPKFMETDHISREMLILPQDVENAVETNLFTPIERVSDCLANGVPIKRGVLLGGKYGTGKTLAATVASRLCVDNGVTFLYIMHADELGDAINFSKQYQSPACVIFCEDIDRSMSGERSVEMDQILNTIDGIDAKYNQVIVVLTTNEIEKINAAMLRPGRLDAVIDVTPPDAVAVQRLLRFYGGSAIEPDADLSEAGKALDGAIPAVIAEVVKRAKLAQLRRQPKGDPVTQVSGAALVEAAKTMEMQIRILKERSEARPPRITIDDLVHNAVARDLQDTIAETVRKSRARRLTSCSPVNEKVDRRAKRNGFVQSCTETI
jgi:transitional endoplasmic reticulum ATPase